MEENQLINKEEYKPFILSENTKDNDSIRNKKYVNQLIDICKTNDCKNIALMGPYSSGKSTILLNFKKDREKQCASINMLEFNQICVENNEIEKIEESIVQQLLYQADKNEIPFSKYRNDYPQKHYLSVYISITLLLILSITLFTVFKLYDKIMNFYISPLCGVIGIICFISIIIFSFVLLYEIMMFICKKFIFSKIKITVKNSEIELNHNSIYNKYIDELFYFFRTTKKRYVIFEDIDRYNDIILFSHLRELNNLLNKSNYFKNNTIKFIYAIKDDLFQSQDRTKFFDYILPILPVIDFSNSYYKFLEHLDFKNKNDELIKNISYYVGDYRIVKNICNEFYTYKSIQENNIISDKNLFGLLVLKNLYPKEFSRIQNENGIINYLINEKKNFIYEKIKPLKDKLNILNKMLNEEIYSIEPDYSILGIIYNIYKKNKDKLSSSYSYKITGLSNTIHNPRNIFDQSINWEELINETISTLDFNCIQTTTYSFKFSINDNLKEQFKKLYKIHTIQESNKNYSRLEIYKEINKINDNIVYYLNIKISNLYKSDEKLFDQVIENYIKETNQDNLEYIDLKYKSFLKLLVFNDVLNENYKTFISLTYLKKNEQDINFIRNVVANIQNDFTQEIVDIEYIHDQLQEDICKKESFNINIVKYLAVNNIGLLNKLIINSKDKIKILYSELNENDNLFKIIAKVVLQNNNKFLINIDKTDLIKFNAWLKILMFIDSNYFDNENIENLKNYIINYKFTNLHDISLEEINNFVKNMNNIKFEDIVGCLDNNNLYNAILNNNMYEINYINLSTIDADLDYYKLTTNSFVKSYIDSHLDNFLSILINNDISTIQAESFTLLAINKVQEDKVCQYIKKFKPLLSDFSVINTQELALALASNKENIINLLSKKGLDNNIKTLILLQIIDDDQFISDKSNLLSDIIIKDKIIDLELLNKEFYHKLFINNTLDVNKDKLLEICLDLLNNNNIIKFLSYYNYNFKKRKFDLSKNPLNEKISNKLQKFNLYRVEDDGSVLHFEKISMRPKKN